LAERGGQRTDHLADELELVLGLLDELLDLAAADAVLDALPVLLLLADLEAVAGEGLDGLPVALVLGDGLDLVEGVRARVASFASPPAQSAGPLAQPVAQDPPEEHPAAVFLFAGGVSAW
jgi:hypothetical protein